jgi:hypothetical protein
MKRFSVLAIIFLMSTLGQSQNTDFKRVEPCSFGVDIPVEMSIKKMYDESSPDYCDYEVKLKNGYLIMELHSLVKSRFSYNTISELYNAAVKASQLNITYKTLGSSYFIISGFNKENGNIVYWKRVLGAKFVSDLRIEYNQSRKYEIEKHIGRISGSFTSR